jgi:hypothetical protein
MNTAINNANVAGISASIGTGTSVDTPISTGTAMDAPSRAKAAIDPQDSKTNRQAVHSNPLRTRIKICGTPISLDSSFVLVAAGQLTILKLLNFVFISITISRQWESLLMTRSITS